MFHQNDNTLTMKLVHDLLRDEVYKDYIERNFQAEQTRIYCKHTFQHMLSVARITYILMMESGEFSTWIKKNTFDNQKGKEIIYLAALLHDIGRWEEYITGESHAFISARYAEVILKKIGLFDAEITICTDAISEHRTSCFPATVLGKNLQMADKISRECWSCEASYSCKNLGIMEARFGLML
jgi:uncharacterized protein